MSTEFIKWPMPVAGELTVTSSDGLVITTSATGTPLNTTTPAGYLKIDINGVIAYIPYFA